MRSARRFLAAISLLGAAAPAGAAGWTLPRPAAGTTAVEAASIRARGELRPDGSFEARTALTLLNTSRHVELLVLECPLPDSERDSLVVALAGESLPLSESADGVRTTIGLEPNEVVVVEVVHRVQADLVASLPADAAGWYGRSRGPLLQPMLRIEIDHAAGSAFASATLDLEIDLGAQATAASVFPTPGSRFAGGTISWSRDAERPRRVAWAALPSRSFLPRTAAEAAAFADYWSVGRRIAADAVRDTWRDLESAGPDLDAATMAAAQSLRVFASGIGDSSPASTVAAARPRRTEPPRERAPEPAPAPAEPPAAESLPGESAPAPGESAGEPDSPVASTAAAPTPARPPVPWIRSAVDARIFLSRERALGGVRAERVEDAIALMEAHHGKPFIDEPTRRARFEGEAWYAPSDPYETSSVSLAEKEALTLLRHALPDR